MTLLGSVLFLLFALIYLYEAYSEYTNPSPSPADVLSSSSYSLDAGLHGVKAAGQGMGAVAGQVGGAIMGAAGAAGGPVDVVAPVGMAGQVQGGRVR